MHKGYGGFPGSSAGKESPCNSGDPGSIPDLGRSPGKGIGCPPQYSWASLVAQMVKNPPTMWETWVWSLGWEDPLEEGRAARSSILAWRSPWTEEPGGPQAMRSQRAEWLTVRERIKAPSTARAGLPQCLGSKDSTCQRKRWKRLRFSPVSGRAPEGGQWQPAPGQRSLAGSSPWGHKSQTRLNRLSKADSPGCPGSQFPCWLLLKNWLSCPYCTHLHSAWAKFNQHLAFTSSSLCTSWWV